MQSPISYTAGNISAAVLLACLSALLAPAHDVITSTVSFHRDIRPILQSRCISCHHSGGEAFSLSSYQEARPWAKAIAEEVLRRSMPPWGAVPGFGDFQNDPSLTMSQMQRIAEWAEGGAPEGEPLAETAAAEPAVQWEALTSMQEISGSPVLKEAISLDAVAVIQARRESSFRLSAELPDGGILPVLWIQSYLPGSPQQYRYRTTLQLPAGTVIRGVPAGVVIQLLSARPAGSELPDPR